MTQPRNQSKEPKSTLQSRLRELGFKLGNAERNNWYGQPDKYERMRKAHESMLSKQYNLV